MLTLRAGLLALADDRILPARLFDGIGDTFRILQSMLDEAPEAAFDGSALLVLPSLRDLAGAGSRRAGDPVLLSGSDGSVLDPIVAVRYCLTLDPDQSVSVDMVTGVAETREQALSLVDKYQDRRLADRVLDLAWTHSQVVLRQLNASEVDAQLHARLAGSVIFANAGLRAEAEVLIRNRRGQSGLSGYAISGDLPIVLLQIADVANLALVRQLVQAHAYWRLKGLAVDLVI